MARARQTKDALLRHADAALYAAKPSRRDGRRSRAVAPLAAVVPGERDPSAPAA
jgi:hypothetical protein